MECKKQNLCSTPTKTILSFHGFMAHQHLDNYETPPARIRQSKLKNPFETVQRENLGTNFISPSLFANKTPLKVDNNFKWTIDELSTLKPAEIDETASNQYGSPDYDSHFESLAQSKIDSYFSMQEILPSPAHPCIPTPLITTESDLSPISRPSMTSSAAQTILSLPPILPEEIEKVLRPYFTFTENQQGRNVKQHNESLYRKLFVCPGDNQERCDSIASNAEHSDIFLSPAKEASPLLNMQNTSYQRTIGTPGNLDTINFCPLSPMFKKLTNETPKRQDYNSSQHMSMDGSFNVPNCSIIEKPDNTSQLDSSYHSSEILSNSTMNWDLEYKQVAAHSPNASLEEMDVSRSNTPKMRIKSSQRKKLSDSFGNDANSEDDDMIISQQSLKVDSESGYQTGYTQNFDTSSQAHTPTEESTALWESDDIVSSTPSKRKQRLQSVHQTDSHARLLRKIPYIFFEQF